MARMQRGKKLVNDCLMMAVSIALGGMKKMVVGRGISDGDGLPPRCGAT
jgi:hypothetical protein